MVDIFLLEQLVTFAHAGTLSRAAHELHISQPALSRSMKRLEDLFGVPLFTRSHSKIAMNETGRLAVRHAERVLEAERDMLDRTRAFDRGLRTVSFGACTTLPAYDLMPVLQESCPGMGVSLTIDDDAALIAQLHRGERQFAILHARPDDADLFCLPYFEERLAVMLPADHALASHTTLAFDDLAGLSILADGGARFWLDVCRRNLPNTRLLLQDTMDALRAVVAASSLPVFSSNCAQRQNTEPPGRVTLPLRDDAACVMYQLACLDENRTRWEPVFAEARRRRDALPS